MYITDCYKFSGKTKGIFTIESINYISERYQITFLQLQQWEIMSRSANQCLYAECVDEHTINVLVIKTQIQEIEVYATMWCLYTFATNYSKVTVI